MTFIISGAARAGGALCAGRLSDPGLARGGGMPCPIMVGEVHAVRTAGPCTCLPLVLLVDAGCIMPGEAMRLQLVRCHPAGWTR